MEDTTEEMIPNEPVEPFAAKLPVIVDLMVTAYQYGDKGQFIGPYVFHKNLDAESIHMPPNTTLEEPPLNVPAGRHIFWNGVSWVIGEPDQSWNASNAGKRVE